MRAYDIIKSKRDGFELKKNEINFFVEQYIDGKIPDYQASALLMAMYINKMTKSETINLTEAMMNTGKIIDLSDIKGKKVDKHSTGGVGDKTTIALAPIVASCGVPVAKMSGRGLGHTGGTIDKLESIRGLSIDMNKTKFIDSVNLHKIAICGQNDELAVADKKLYSLRDVTATVDNVSLIASSIMSKKLATGADSIVLDVKTGQGAFMKNLDDSFELARLMVDIGNSMNRDTIAVITSMEQPLGKAIGNSLEVIEAIETLKGRGPDDFNEIVETLASYMLLAGDIVSNYDEGLKKVRESIKHGNALNKLKEFIENQGGCSKVVDDYSLFDRSKFEYDFMSNKEGYITEINAEEVGNCAKILGAGREVKGEKIDLSVGIILRKKVGDYIKYGESLATIYYNDEKKFLSAKKVLSNVYIIDSEKPSEDKLIIGVVTKDKFYRKDS